MAVVAMNSFLRNLRRVLRLPEPDGEADARLVERFVATHDEAAFAALVERHGPMVLGVCRRVLRDEHAAEDAFQATFLVLVRRAASIRPTGMVGNWLHGVAYRTALNARTLNARRRAKENEMRDIPQEEPGDADAHDLPPLLDHELQRLPDKYRASIVLCDLEGKSRQEAARQLGLPEGTLSSRLARAREMLGQRLTRRGVALSAGVAAALTEHAAPAAVPSTLLTSTIQTGARVAGGQALAAAASAPVAVLTEGVLRAMFITRMKIAAALLLTVGILGTGAGVVAHQALRAQAAPATPVADAANLTAPGEPAGPKSEKAPPAEVAADEKEPPKPDKRKGDLAGEVVRILDNGRTIELSVPARNKGEAPTTHTIKLTDKSQVTFNGVGPNGAKPTVGQSAQVWWDAENKEIVARVQFVATVKRTPDLVGRVVAIEKDWILTLEVPAKNKGEAATRTKVMPGKKALITFYGVGPDGAKPAEGYLATVWLENDPFPPEAFARKDPPTAAEIRFDGPSSGDKEAKRNPDKPKPDSPKPDKPKPDATKPESPKTEKPKSDARPDTPKPDKPKPDATKPESKIEKPKPETPKTKRPAEPAKPAQNDKRKPAPADQPEKPSKTEPEAAASAAPAREFAAIATVIDREIDRRLLEAKVPASPRADDAEFLRRVTLDITGRIPTLAEARAFL